MTLNGTKTNKQKYPSHILQEKYVLMTHPR